MRRCLSELEKMSPEQVMAMRKKAQDCWKEGFQSRVLLERMLKG